MYNELNNKQEGILLITKNMQQRKQVIVTENDSIKS